jgi:hypothetical protein
MMARIYSRQETRAWSRCAAWPHGCLLLSRMGSSMGSTLYRVRGGRRETRRSRYINCESARSWIFSSFPTRVDQLCRQTPAGPWATGQRLHVTPASFGKMQAQMLYPPSATAKSALMPFRLESSNPTKVIDDQSWKLYVVDLVS